MELIWNETNAERLVKTVKTQFRVSGKLPAPDGRPVAETAGTGAAVKIDSAVIGENEITLCGKVKAVVTAFGDDRELFSYESTADFENVIKTDGVLVGMRAEVSTCIQSVSAVPSGNGVDLDADVDVFIMIMTDKPLRVLGGVAGVPDLETRTSRFPVSKCRSLGNAVLRLREEIAAEDVSRIISCEGTIAVRDVTIDQGGASVSGMMTVSGIASSSKGHVSQIIRQLPFHERIEISGIGSDAFCRATAEGIYMRALGEEFGIISLEAEVGFEVFCIDHDEAELPTDVFSPSICFDCLTENETIVSFIGDVSAQSSIREALTLGSSSQDVKEPLFARALPIITEYSIRDGAVDVSGIFVTTAVYESTSDRICTVSEDVPFSVSFDIPAKADLPVISASCIAGISSINERSVQIQYNLLLGAKVYSTNKIKAAVGLAETERKDRPGGIVICFASEGEDVFDIAKRFGTSCASVRELNPDIAEPFSEGERLLLLV